MKRIWLEIFLHHPNKNRWLCVVRCITRVKIINYSRKTDEGNRLGSRQVVVLLFCRGGEGP